MGNCSGFCMTSNQEGETQNKKLTQDKVRSALQEKDELYNDRFGYEDVQGNAGVNNNY